MPNDYKALMQALINGGVDIDPKSVSEEYLLNVIRSSGIEGLPEPKSRLDAYLGALITRLKQGGSGGSSESVPTKLSDLENDLYYHDKLVPRISINSNEWRDSDGNLLPNIGYECEKHPELTEFDAYYYLNDEVLENMHSSDEIGYTLIVKVGDETFKFSKSDLEYYFDDAETWGEFCAYYGTGWTNTHDLTDLSTITSSLVGITVDIFIRTGEEYSCEINVFGHTTNPDVSFTLDICETQTKKIPKECLDVSISDKLSGFENDLYYPEGFIPRVSVDSSEWLDENGMSGSGVGITTNRAHPELSDFDLRYQYNDEVLEKVANIDEIDFVLTARVGDEIFKISKSDMNIESLLYNKDGIFTSVELQYGLDWNEVYNLTDLSAISSSLVGLYLAVRYSSSEELHFRVQITGSTTSPDVSFTLDIFAKHSKKIPRECLDITEFNYDLDILWEQFNDHITVRALNEWSYEVLYQKWLNKEFANVRLRYTDNRDKESRYGGNPIRYELPVLGMWYDEDNNRMCLDYADYIRTYDKGQVSTLAMYDNGSGNIYVV